MGFIHANTIPIHEDHRARPFSGRLLLFGQGDNYFSMEAFERMAKVAVRQLIGAVTNRLTR